METATTTPRIDELVQQTIGYLKQKIHVQRVILFGSYARGDADKWSDLDLAVISPDFTGMSHANRMDLLVKLAMAVDSMVEVRPYTPEEFKEARPTNFLGHILTEGKVVYEDVEPMVEART